MTALTRLDFALDVLDRFLVGLGSYSRQKKVRWIMWYRPWVVIPDIWRRAVRQARDARAHRMWKVRIDFLFRSGNWDGAMSEVREAMNSFQADVERLEASLGPEAQS